MTILPTKRTVSNNSGDENKDTGTNNNSKDRTSRHREEHNVAGDNTNGPNRRPFNYSGSSSERGKELQKLYKETPIDSIRDRRERERQKQRELRRERKRERQAKRTSRVESNADISGPSTSGDSVDAGPSNANSKKSDLHAHEDGSGCNSEDEYDSRRGITGMSRVASEEEWARRDDYFSRCLQKLGFEIKKMHEDGACLFRAIADQVYGDQELHSTVRSQCMDYIVKNQDFFAPYVTEDFDKYVERKRRWHVHGNHLEIQALSEMYNRTIEVYCYHTDKVHTHKITPRSVSGESNDCNSIPSSDPPTSQSPPDGVAEPINIFNAASRNSYEPIRVSYHRMCHYNSITNPKKPSVLVGLGLPNYCTRCDLDRRDVHDAVRQSEELLIEQTMLEDKIKATDWEATNEALEEQVARESYIQYYRDVERRLKSESHSNVAIAGSSTSTITSATCSSPRSRRGSVSPKGPMSPKGGSSPKNCYTGQTSPRLSNTTLIDSNSTHPTFDNSELVFSQQLLSMDFTKDSSKPSTRQAYSMDCQKNNEVVMPDTGTSLAAQVDSSAMETEDCNYPSENYQDWDETIMAQVLAESQLTYFDDLKRKATKKRNGSPGPSTSQ